MLDDEIDDPAALTPDDLRARYEAALVETVDRSGAAAVADRSDVDRETVDALAAESRPTVTVEDAAAILATREDRPTKDAILGEVRDTLLMGMTTAVLDVDTIAADVEMGSKEIQQKIEGRTSATLAEYALLRHYIATENDR